MSINLTTRTMFEYKYKSLFAHYGMLNKNGFILITMSVYKPVSK